jgi:acyl-CoA synthetase (AMP-forming)/AMP-acid ligase II
VLVSDLASRAVPTHVALCSEDRPPLSFGGLSTLVDATAASLHRRGLGTGAPVALMLANGPELASAFLALSAATAVAPLNPAFKDAELEFYLADLGAKALVTTPDHETACRVARRLGLDVLLVERRPGEPAGVFHLEGEAGTRAGVPGRRPEPGEAALLLHTSGTTARPKLVALTHANLCASAQTIAASLDLSPSDRCLNIMPLFHVHGLVAAVLASLAAGASVYCSPGFNAHRFFSWLTDSRATWYTAVPTMHQAIVGRARVNQDALASHRLRFVRTCSAPLPIPAWRALEDTFRVPVISAYGMTEASHQISCTPATYPDSKRGTVGRATGVEVATMDEEGRVLLPGVAGEVVIRGDSVIQAYAGNASATAASFRSGWFRTGDEGRLDADGYLTLTARLKEIINTGGEKVAPLEVDAVLMEHPGVAQALAFAVPDPSLGERVAAVVVLRPGADATPESLRAFAAERLAKFKVPRTILILDAIPTGPTGKFQRTAMARQLGLD